MATITELVNRIAATTGRSDKSATILQIVNDSMRDIQLDYNLYFMEEVVGRMVLENQHKYALPSDFKDWGEVVLLEHQGTVRPGGNATAISSNAGDIDKNLTLVYVDYVGDLREETVALAGDTIAPFNGGMAQIKSAVLSEACLGTVSVKTADTGVTLLTIAPGVTSAEYTVEVSERLLSGPRAQSEMLAKFGVLSTGMPQFFTEDRGELRVWPPLPDEAKRWSLRLRYYRMLPDLSGTQTNELTTRWASLVEAKATARFYRTLPNGTKEAMVWDKAVEHPLSGMPALVRMSNLRRLQDMHAMRARFSEKQTTRRFGR